MRGTSNRKHSEASITRPTNLRQNTWSLRGKALVALLFSSGLASLVYQVLWIKRLSLVVGVEVQTMTTAVSGFFAGLAIGGYLWGRLADRLGRPLLLYAFLEIGVAILAVGASLALAHTAPLFAHLEASTGPLAWLLPFLLVGAPAVLMGVHFLSSCEPLLREPSIWVARVAVSTPPTRRARWLARC